MTTGVSAAKPLKKHLRTLFHRSAVVHDGLVSPFWKGLDEEVAVPVGQVDGVEVLVVVVHEDLLAHSDVLQGLDALVGAKPANL